MDKSKEFILMCEKAEEIQNLWSPTVGDYHTCYKWKEVHTVEFDYESDEPKIVGIRPYIWLPRQDQLQTFSGLSWQEFDWRCANEYPLTITKEQAGIQVVMKEKYKKVWTGKDWEDNQDES